MSNNENFGMAAVIVSVGLLFVALFGFIYAECRAEEKHRSEMVSRGCKLYKDTLICEGKVNNE